MVWAGYPQRAAALEPEQGLRSALVVDNPADGLACLVLVGVKVGGLGRGRILSTHLHLRCHTDLGFAWGNVTGYK